MWHPPQGRQPTAIANSSAKRHSIVVMLVAGPCSSRLSRTAGAILAFAFGCSAKTPAPAPSLPSFHDIAGAPPAIRSAAAAIVRIATAGELATGSFVSSDGLLLTNNHVLGAPVCAIEGCAVALNTLDQRGQPVTPAIDVFAVPVAVDIGRDVSFVQVYSSASDTSGGKMSTPSYLSIRSVGPASLVGTHVTIVGHPEGHLKKWTDGTVVDSFGDWFASTAYILPGDSGSPVLDDSGSLVGIIHRSPTGEDLIAGDTVDVFSIGTASAPILAAMQEPLPPVMVSTQAAATSADVVARDRLYLNARVHRALADGTPTSVLTLLGRACDAALAEQDFRSPEDLSTALAPCDDAMLWIECRSDATAVPYGIECPSVDIDAWTARFQAMNARWRAMNGTTYLAPVSFGIASLQTSNSLGLSAGSTSLQKALADAQEPIDFGIANYLAAFGVASYGQTTISTYVAGYARVPGYAISATSIASAAVWLANDGVLSADAARNVLTSLQNDPSVSVGTKLYVEDLLHQGGVDP
jgi:V8-like Glu-specific endopeptidase